MRKLQIALAVLSFSATAGAFAETPYPVEKPFVSTLTRAQVRQDLVKAEQQGLITEGDDYPIVAQAASSLSRQDVERQVNSTQGNTNDATYSGA